MAFTVYCEKGPGYGTSVGDTIDFKESSLKYTSGAIASDISVTAISCSITYCNTNSASSGTGTNLMDVQVRFSDSGTWYTIGQMKHVGRQESQITMKEFTKTTNTNVLSMLGKQKIYDIRCSVTAGYWYVSSNGTITIACTTSSDTSACSAPTTVKVSVTDAAPKTNVTLSWSGAKAGSNNSIKEYQIYRSDSSATGNYSLFGNTSNTSYTVNPPDTLNKSYYYKIVTVGSAGYNSEKSTAYASLKCSYSAPTAPTSITIDNVSTLYKGSSDKDEEVTLRWSGASNGINNPISGYRIYRATKGSDSYSDLAGVSSTTTSYKIKLDPSLGVTRYKILALGSSNLGDSSKSNGTATISWIASPKAPTFTVPNYVTSNFTLSWTAVSAPSNSKITYDVSYGEKNSLQVLKTGITTTSCSITPLPVSRWKNFVIKITARATASNGGYEESSKTSEEILYGEDFTIPATTSQWTGCYDPNSNLKNGIQPYVYDKVSLSWKAASSTKTNMNFTYELQYSINDSSWTAIKSGTNLLQCNEWTGITKIAEGSTVYFRIVVKDEYNPSKIYQKITVTRLKKPSLSNVTVTTGRNNERDLVYTSFKWSPGDSYGANPKCEITLSHNTETKTYDVNNLTNNNSIINENIDVTLPKTDPKTGLFGALYSTVIDNRISRPKGSAKIKISTVNFPNCMVEQTVNFDYNYRRSITTMGNFNLITINNHEKYYNPGDKIGFVFTKATFTDAAGGTTGAQLTYKISGNNNTWERTPGEYKDLDTAPAANTDLSIKYTLTATLSYADYTETKTKTVTAMVARWTDTDVLSIANIKKTETGFECDVKLPNTYPWASKEYSNLSSIIVGIRIEGSNNDEKTKPITDFDEPIHFSIESDIKNNFNIQATAKPTNSSGNTLGPIFSAYYLVRTADYTMAIRDGRVGINTDESFKTDTNASSLLVYSKPGSNTESKATIEVVSAREAGTEKFIDFKLGSEKDTVKRGIRMYSDMLTIDGIFNSSGILPVNRGGTGANTKIDALKSLRAFGQIAVLDKDINLDDIKDMGTYYATAEIAATLTNSPIESAFILEVVDSGGRLVQRLTRYGTTGVSYYRVYSSTTWYDWSRVLSSTVKTAIGSSTQPVYVNANGAVVACTGYSGLLTDFSSSANTLSLTVGGTKKEATIINSVSNTWTGGTSNGPTLKTIVNGKESSAIAIPAATDSASGIITTANQKFSGNKNFYATYLRLTDNSTSGYAQLYISGTNYGLYANNATTGKWMVYINDNGDVILNGNAATATKLSSAKTIRTNLESTTAVGFDGSGNITPGIEGTLNINHGGTGATTALNARKNLGAFGYVQPLTTENLNEVMTPGVYHATSTYSGTVTNTPTKSAFILEVIDDNGRYIQRVTRYGETGTGTTYFRAYGGTTWQDWAQVITSTNISNFASLPFKIAYGSATINDSSTPTTINYSSTGFTDVPVIVASFSRTEASSGTDSGLTNSVIKIHTKTKTSCLATINGSTSGRSAKIDWIAIGT